MPSRFAAALVSRPLPCARLGRVAALLTLLIALLPPALAQTPPTAVIASRVSMTSWSDPLTAQGTLQADESVTLSATVTATVQALNFHDGEAVAAGQLLVQLNDAVPRAELRAAEALRDERRATLARLVQLQSRNLAPRAEVEDARAQLRQAEAQAQALQARLAHYRLEAPFAGRVGLRQISPGTLVTPGTDLATLDKLDVMKLDFTLPESVLGQLTPGLALSATSAAFPETRFHGAIASIATRVDPVARSVTLRARLDNPQRQLRPGMLLQVQVQRPPRQALVIPESALIPEGRRHSVLVLDETDHHRVTRREIRIGARRPGEVEVREGLRAGELVVAHGTERVRPGQATRLLGILDEATSVSELLRRDRAADPAVEVNG